MRVHLATEQRPGAINTRRPIVSVSSVLTGLLLTKFVRTVRMDEHARAEPSLSVANCVDLELYRPVVQFQVDGRI